MNEEVEKGKEVERRGRRGRKSWRSSAGDVRV
jgi:hypothetical protein